MIRKPTSGMSLVELVVAVAVSSVIVMATVQLGTLALRGQKDVERRIEEMDADIIIKKYLRTDLENSDGSIDVFNASRAHGSTQVFDVNPLSDCMNSGSCARKVFFGDRAVSQIATWVALDSELVILTETKKGGSAVFVRPEDAYQHSPSKSGSPGDLNFDPGKLKAAVEAENSEFWQEGNFLLFQALTLIYRGSGIPRKLSVLARVLKKDSSDLVYSDLGGRLLTQHPLRANLSVDNADRLFWYLPSFGGQATLAMVRNVTPVRYSFIPETVNGRKTISVYRSIWDPKLGENGDFPEKGTLLGTGLSHIEIQRSSVRLADFEVVVHNMPGIKSIGGR